MCALADAMGVPPSVIGRWKSSDVMMMVKFYKYRNSRDAGGNAPPEIADMEALATAFGVENVR